MSETIERTDGTNANTFHCLLTSEEIFLTNIGEEMDKTANLELLKFCRRPNIRMRTEPSPHESKLINGQEFKFDYLRKIGVSAKDLFDWNAPLDTIEAYISGENDGVFVNCSHQKDNFWFGPWCQYTLGKNAKLGTVIENRNTMKAYTSPQILLYTNGTCYPVKEGECQSILCLDWREICDGKFSFVSDIQSVEDCSI